MNKKAQVTSQPVYLLLIGFKTEFDPHSLDHGSEMGKQYVLYQTNGKANVTQNEPIGEWGRHLLSNL